VSRSVVRRPVTRVRLGQEPQTRPDSLATEEPLEIRVAGRPLAVTMRTPGTPQTDWDLATGFLLTEGFITSAAELATIRYCAGAVATLVPGPGDEDAADTSAADTSAGDTPASDTSAGDTPASDTSAADIAAGAADGAVTGAPGATVPQNTYNVLDVTLAPGVPTPDPSLERAFYTTSSCGVCGKASIDAVRTRSVFAVRDDPVALTPEFVLGLPDRLRAAQRVFDTTGGLHGAALVDPSGVLPDLVREDVGRHNAVDKVLGAALRSGGVPARGRVLVVSGRASFELTQKALMAGVPALVAVSAPSSLAAELAEAVGMTLAGFVRGTSMVLYAGAQRITDADRAAS